MDESWSDQSPSMADGRDRSASSLPCVATSLGAGGRTREHAYRASREWDKIVVSGGFDAEKIARFEAADVPVDSYGVGSSLLRGDYDFTADVVRVEGAPVAKVGRRERPNPRLERVE